MSDDPVDMAIIDVRAAPAARLGELGDSALGHAVQRIMTGNDGRADSGSETAGSAPIAAFQDHV